MAGAGKGGDVPHRVVRGTADVPARLRELEKRQLHAVLATAAEGKPYTSLVACALVPGGTGVLFATGRRTRKYRNILANAAVSILIDTRANSGRDYLSAESLTIEGNARPLRRGRRRDEMRRVFLTKHPALKAFVADRETALVLVEAEQIVHVGHFQEVTVWKAGR